MTPSTLVGKLLDSFARNGAIRTIGAVAGFCGRAIEDRCEWLAKIREWDRGKGYPLRLRLRAARLGLSAHSYLWLGLADGDADEYLKSVDPLTELNRRHIDPVNNKYTFQLLTEPYVDCLPALYGVIDEGEFTSWPEPGHDEEVFPILNRDGALVLKPTLGGKGDGIYVVRQHGSEGFSVNGRRVERGAIADMIAGLDDYLVTEFIHQHPYADSIFPDATNTLRVFSVIDPGSKAPRVLRATHRFGSAASAPTDNWSRGGYAAPVDVDTGTIKRLILLDDPPRRRLDTHPETGSQIRGVTVPYWDEVCDLIVELADLHREAPLVGWDVVVSGDGPVLIEANARPGKELLQPERGVFEDESVRRLLDPGWKSTSRE